MPLTARSLLTFYQKKIDKLLDPSISDRQKVHQINLKKYQLARKKMTASHSPPHKPYQVASVAVHRTIKDNVTWQMASSDDEEVSSDEKGRGIGLTTASVSDEADTNEVIHHVDSAKESSHQSSTDTQPLILSSATFFHKPGTTGIPNFRPTTDLPTPASANKPPVPYSKEDVAAVSTTDHKTMAAEFKKERIARRDSSLLRPGNAAAVALKPAPTSGEKLLQNLFDMSGLAKEDLSIKQLLGIINYSRRNFSPEYNEWVELAEKSAKLREHLNESKQEKITVPYDGGNKSYTFHKPNFAVLVHTTPLANALEILKDKGASLLDCWKICLSLLQDGLHGYTACHGIPSVALVLRFKPEALLDVQPRDVNTPSHFARAKGSLAQTDSETSVIKYVKLQLQYLEFAYKLQKMFFEARIILRLYPIRLMLYQLHYELIDLAGKHGREDPVLNNILDLMRSDKLGELGIAAIKEIFEKIKNFINGLKASNAQNGNHTDRINAKMTEAVHRWGKKAVDDAMEPKKSIATHLARTFKLKKSKQQSQKEKAQVTENEFIKAMKSYIFKDIQWGANDTTLDQIFARILQDLEKIFALQEIPIPDFSPDKEGQAPIARYIEETIKIVKMMVGIKPAGSCKKGGLDELEKWVFRTILELEPNTKSVFEMLDEMLTWTVTFCENYKRDVRKAGDEGDVTQFRAPMSPTEAIKRTKLWMEINALGSGFFPLELVGVAVESALIQEGMSADMVKCFDLAKEKDLDLVWIQSGPIAEKLGFFLHKFLIASVPDEIVQRYKDKKVPTNRPLGLIIEYLKQAAPNDGLDIQIDGYTNKKFQKSNITHKL